MKYLVSLADDAVSANLNAVPPHLNADGFGIGWYVDVPEDDNVIEEWHPEDNAVGGSAEGS